MITGKKQIWPTWRRIYEKSDSVRRNFTWSVEGRVSFYRSIKQLQWKVGAGSRRLNPLCEPEIIFCTNTGRNKVPPVLSNRTMATAHLQSAPTWCTTFKVENFANGRERERASAKCYLLNAAAANFCSFRPIFIATGRIRRSIKVYLAAAAAV